MKKIPHYFINDKEVSQFEFDSMYKDDNNLNTLKVTYEYHEDLTIEGLNSKINQLTDEIEKLKEYVYTYANPYKDMNIPYPNPLPHYILYSCDCTSNEVELKY